MKLSEWFNEKIEEIKINVDDYDLSDEEKSEWLKFSNEFWEFKGEDREIVLKDLMKDEGLLYKKVVEFNENELVIELGMGNDMWEYSIEDGFRDEFGDIFGLRNVNMMVYGEDYNDGDWDYND
jgi:hypothetical protein